MVVAAALSRQCALVAAASAGSAARVERDVTLLVSA
jgi:hypothetical protein